MQSAREWVIVTERNLSYNTFRLIFAFAVCSPGTLRSSPSPPSHPIYYYWEIFGDLKIFQKFFDFPLDSSLEYAILEMSPSDTFSNFRKENLTIMNPSTAAASNGIDKRVIEKEIEHPVTGDSFVRKANITWPEIPSDDIAKLLQYFGGSTERIAKALNLALAAKMSSLYNNRLKGGEVMRGIARVRKGLELAGLDKAAIDLMIQGNPALSASVNVADINDDYSAEDIAKLFDAAPEPGEVDPSAGVISVTPTVAV